MTTDTIPAPPPGFIPKPPAGFVPKDSTIPAPPAGFVPKTESSAIPPPPSGFVPKTSAPAAPDISQQSTLERTGKVIHGAAAGVVADTAALPVAIPQNIVNKAGPPQHIPTSSDEIPWYDIGAKLLMKLADASQTPEELKQTHSALNAYNTAHSYRPDPAGKIRENVMGAIGPGEIRPPTTAEKIFVDAPAGIAKAVAEIGINKKLLPAGADSEVAAWEAQNQAAGGTPGHGAAMGAAVGSIGKMLPGAPVKAAAAEGALFGTTTYLTTGDVTESLINGLIPAGLRTPHAIGWARGKLSGAKTPEARQVTVDEIGREMAHQAAPVDSAAPAQPEASPAVQPPIVAPIAREGAVEGVSEPISAKEESSTPQQAQAASLDRESQIPGQGQQSVDASLSPTHGRDDIPAAQTSADQGLKQPPAAPSSAAVGSQASVTPRSETHSSSEGQSSQQSSVPEPQTTARPVSASEPLPSRQGEQLQESSSSAQVGIRPAAEIRQEQSSAVSRENLTPPAAPAQQAENTGKMFEQGKRIPLSQFGETVHSENSPDKAIRILSPKGGGLGVNDTVWLSNNVDLATGQAGNKGVKIEFDSKDLQGVVGSSKPGAEFQSKQGNYEAMGSDRAEAYQKAAKRVTLDAETTKNPRAQRLARELTSKGWTEKRNADGSVTYDRPPTKPPAAAKEPAPAEPLKTTSARKADMDVDRKAMGTDTLNSPERQSWQTALDAAKSQGIPDRAMRLAEEVNAEPRALSDIETAGLVVHATKLKNEHATLMDEIGKAKGADIQTKSAEANRVEQEFDQLSRALRVSGTEKGRALAAQKLTIDQNFDLVSVLNRAKSAKGAELKPAERARFEEMTKRLDESNARIETLEKQMKDQIANNALRSTRARIRNPGADLQTKYAKLKELLAAGCKDA